MRPVGDALGGRRALAATVVLVAGFTLLALAGTNGLLRGMHPDEARAYSIGSLAPLSPLAAEERVERVVRVWREHERSVRSQFLSAPATARQVVRVHVVTDMLFVAAYVIGLVAFFRRSRDGAASPGERRLAGVVLGVVGWTAAADAVENLLQLRVVSDAWADGDAGAVWPFLLSVAADAKWAGTLVLLLIGLPLAWLRLQRWRARAGASVRDSLERLRIHAVVVALFAGIVLGHDQLADVIRAWNYRQLGWSVLGAGALAVLVWVSGAALLAHGVRTKTAREQAAGRPPALIAFAAAGAACALAVVDLTTSLDVGWGFGIAGLIVLAIALLGYAFRGEDGDSWVPPEPIDAGAPGYPLVRILPAAVVVALGFAVFKASWAQAVYLRNLSPDLLVVAAGLGVAGAVRVLGVFERLERRLPLFGYAWIVAGAGVAFAVLRIHHGNVEIEPSVLVATGIFLGYVGWWLHGLLGFYGGYDRRLVLGIGAGGSLSLLALWILMVANPWWVAFEFGGIALVAGFLGVVALVGWLLVWVNDGVRPPAALRALRVRRTPVLVLLVVWLVLAAVLDRGGYHDVRTLPGDERDGGVTVTEAWDCWLQKNALADGPCRTEKAGGVRSTGPIPLVFVATSGGGIRAAYWTALVMDCAFEVEARTATVFEPCQTTRSRAGGFARSNALFAASGISGGSYGLAVYASFLAEKTGRTEAGWLRKRMDDDSLSASVAWWLFVETPRLFLRFHNPTDRAEVLERGWERDWRRATGSPGALERPFLALQREQPELPLLLLSGTSVADGCRFNVSVLDANFEAAVAPRPDELERCRSTEAFDRGFGAAPSSAFPGTRDLVDFLCEGERDLPLSSAALLSGRFPFVSPSGRIEQPCGGRRVSYVVDGGYLETSGASPVLELMTRLQPKIDEFNAAADDRCIVPFLIQIDNGADPGPDNLSKRPQELLVPLQTVFAARGGRAALARTQAALQFTSAIPGVARVDRYAHFTNLAHPGPQPPLGWTLSEFSREDLRGQLGQAQNVEAFQEVRRLFAGGAGYCG